MKAFRGTLLRPNTDHSFDVIPDGVLALDTQNIISFLGSIDDIRSQTDEYLARVGFVRENDQLIYRPEDMCLSASQNVILPSTVNTHDHAFQPPAIPGELIRFDDAQNTLVGWLPTTLKHGEYKAKKNIPAARKMITAKLKEFSENGIGAVLSYATSSVETVETILDVAEELGVRIQVGYVAMDQGMNDIQAGLETTHKEAIESTEYLLKTFGPEKIVVIDRFPIAVSSPTRKKLALLARKYGALYETHMDESVNEKNLHTRLYGTPSIVQTLLDDGVFAPGSRVGLAHAIHTTPEEIEKIGEKIDAGCTVFIRACPNSNDHLGSHWNEQNEYVRFPREQWEQIGAQITLGTDQGAGRSFNMFDEMLSEKRRQPLEKMPSHVDLLRSGTIQGAQSMGIHIPIFKTGERADFTVLEMAGAEGFYTPGETTDLETIAARTIEGGQRTNNIQHLYVDGKKILNT